MKKLILIVSVLFLTVTSCTKDPITPTTCQSSCGIIVNDGIDNNCYWLQIQNDCSGNYKTFCFDQNVWMNSYVGESFCVTNEPAW